MKNRFIILLVVAVVLGGIQGRQSARNQQDARAVRAVRTHSPMATLARTLPAMTPWEALELGDYPQLIELLRASGCPEATVRDLVMMCVTREFHARQMTMEEQRHQNLEWWRCNEDDAARLQRNQEARQLRREMKDKMFALLGTPYDELVSGFVAFGDSGARDVWLAPEKREAYAAMVERFQDEKENLQVAIGAWAVTPDGDQKARLDELEKQQRAELTSILSPTELEAYDLRHSDAARYVLEQLPQALSEKEFRAMVKVAQNLGAVPPKAWSDWGVDRAAEQRDAEAKKQEVLSKIQAALGTEVVEAQQKAAEEQAAQEAAAKKVRQQQEMMDEISDMAESVGADRSVGRMLVERLDELKKKLDATLPQPKDLDEKQQDQLKAQILAEVETIAVETMGEKGHEFMKKHKEKESKH